MGFKNFFKALTSTRKSNSKGTNTYRDTTIGTFNKNTGIYEREKRVRIFNESSEAPNETMPPSYIQSLRTDNGQIPVGFITTYTGRGDRKLGQSSHAVRTNISVTLNPTFISSIGRDTNSPFSSSKKPFRQSFISESERQSRIKSHAKRAVNLEYYLAQEFREELYKKRLTYEEGYMDSQAIIKENDEALSRVFSTIFQDRTYGSFADFEYMSFKDQNEYNKMNESLIEPTWHLTETEVGAAIREARTRTKEPRPQLDIHNAYREDQGARRRPSPSWWLFNPKY